MSILIGVAVALRKNYDDISGKEFIVEITTNLFFYIEHEPSSWERGVLIGVLAP